MFFMGQVTMISINKNRNDIDIPKWRRKLPHQLNESYIMRKLPINIEEIFVYGEKCRKIRLPLVQEDTACMQHDFVKKLIQHLIEKEEIEYPYLDYNLEQYREYFCENYSWFISYILFPEIIQFILAKKRCKIQQIHPLVIDSGDRKIEYVLDCMISGLNHLVIQTHRKSYFSEFIRVVYDTYGLVVELIDPDERKLDYYDFIIDLNQDYYKEYLYFKKSATVIDFSSCVEKEQYLSHRRMDLERYNSVSISMRQEKVNEELVSLFMVSQNRRIQQFMKNRTGLTKEEGIELIKSYQFVLRKCELR